MARRLRLHILRASDAKRDHYFLSVCKGHYSPDRGNPDGSCEWYVVYGRSPLKAQREASKHARRRPDHEVQVIDLSSLECVTTYRFSAMDQSESESGAPPF